jgi:hypothetical protein
MDAIHAVHRKIFSSEIHDQLCISADASQASAKNTAIGFPIKMFWTWMKRAKTN